MGVLASIADKLGVGVQNKTLQTVIVKVKMCCEGCEKKVNKALSSMEGAHTVVVDREQHRAEVTGYVEAKDVLRRLRAVGKRGEMWPFVPAYLTAYPYAPGAYDRKAPPGLVRKVEVEPGPLFKQGQAISQALSDDNPNSCSIM